MKKTWIVIVTALGLFFLVQQTVLSQNTQYVDPSGGNTDYCNINNFYKHPERLRSCCIDQTPHDQNCNACLIIPVPTVCYPWITLTPGALSSTPTLPPLVPTLTKTPTPTPRSDILSNQGLTTGGSNSGNGLVISVSSYLPSGPSAAGMTSSGSQAAGSTSSNSQGNGTSTPTPTPTPYHASTGGIINIIQSIIFPTTPPTPTNRPLPTNPIPTNTPIPPIQTNSGNEKQTSSQQPTITPPLPTATPFPSTLSPKQTTAGNKVTQILNTASLTEINIVPHVLAAENIPTQQPILTQEQNQTNVPAASGGLTVTLEQKQGDTFVTQQDELSVQRGNQFFTISNEQNSINTQQKQQNSSTQSNEDNASNIPITPVPQLEINANNVIATSNMGLSVDPLSGILTVQTPAGPQKVSIMPDEALEIVVQLKAINTNGKVAPSIIFVSEYGALLYQISGERAEKFLGLFPLPIQKQILVSADTGSVVKVILPPLSQFLSFFTF